MAKSMSHIKTPARVTFVIDPLYKHWLVQLRVCCAGHSPPVQFIVDSGSSRMLLSRTTLGRLGFRTDTASISRLCDAKTSLADGGEAKFKVLPQSFQLRQGETILGEVSAMCHATNQTVNLIGSELLNKFYQVVVNFGTSPKYIDFNELVRII